MPTNPEFDQRVRKSIERLIQPVLLVLFVVGMVIAGVAMVILFAAGFRTLLVGAVSAYQSHGSDGSSTVVTVLHGFEYLWLAPIAFLLFLTLTRFVQRYVESDVIGPEAAAPIMQIDSLIVGLIMAFLTTDVTSRIVATQAMDVWKALFELLVMIVLCLYLVVLRKTHS